MKLKPREQEVYDYYCREFKNPPTLEEIGKQFGLTRQRADMLMKQLLKKGKLKLDQKRVVYFINDKEE